MNNNNNRYSNQKRNNTSGGRENPPLFDKNNLITEPLSSYYEKRENTYLIDGPIYELACETKSVSSSQLRKILDHVKQAVAIIRYSDQKYEEARQLLFMLLPMMAYQTGRSSKNEKDAFKKLLQFIYRNMNEQSIQEPKDILVFDQLITSLVAYHKYLCPKDNK